MTNRCVINDIGKISLANNDVGARLQSSDVGLYRYCFSLGRGLQDRASNSLFYVYVSKVDIFVYTSWYKSLGLHYGLELVLQL